MAGRAKIVGHDFKISCSGLIRSFIDSKGQVSNVYHSCSAWFPHGTFQIKSHQEKLYREGATVQYYRNCYRDVKLRLHGLVVGFELSRKIHHFNLPFSQSWQDLQSIWTWEAIATHLWERNLLEGFHFSSRNIRLFVVGDLIWQGVCMYSLTLKTRNIWYTVYNMNQIVVPLPACLHGGATFSLPEAIAEAWVWGFDFYTMLEWSVYLEPIIDSQSSELFHWDGPPTSRPSRLSRTYPALGRTKDRLFSMTTWEQSFDRNQLIIIYCFALMQIKPPDPTLRLLTGGFDAFDTCP